MSPAPPPDRESRSRVIRDPVHNYVMLPLELNALVDHPVVQRLRRVSQTSMCATVYPSMSGNRFEHALGSMHMAGRAWEAVCSNFTEARTKFEDDVFATLRQSGDEDGLDRCTAAWIGSRRAFRANFSSLMGLAIQSAALLHDVGHPPFSHALEDFYVRHLQQIAGNVPGYYDGDWQRAKGELPDSPMHEVVGLLLLDYIDPETVESVPWAVVKKIMFQSNEGDWSACLRSLVSGEVDIDRLDYLLRDTKRSGTEFGAFDAERLLQSIEIHHVFDGTAWLWEVGFGIRATSALESFLSQRLQYYRWVVFHPHAIAANRMLNLALERLIRLSSLLRRHDDDVEETLKSSWLTGLNCFASSRDDRDTSPLDVFEVDDCSLFELLKVGRRRCMAEVAATAVPPSTEKAQFLALVKATLHRTPNWAPVWKTDFDYANIASELLPRLRPYLVHVEQQIEQDIDRSAKRDSARQLLIQRRQIRETLDVMDQADADSTRAVAALNGIATKLLAGGPRIRLDAELILGEAMGRHQGSIDLPGGMWILAYEELLAARDDGFGVNVFEGEERRRLTRVSATVEGLNVIDRRPRFYAYYLTVEDTPMRIDRRSLYGRELHDSFMTSFPSAVGEMFRLLV